MSIIMSERQMKWDWRFLELARHVSEWSKDPSTKVGAVIVRPDFTVASVGYNGFPRGLSDAPELYADRGVKYQRVIHAEMNAILNAREPLHGYTLYEWPPSWHAPTCDRCAVHIIQAGIVRVVGIQGGSDRWADACLNAQSMYIEAGIETYMWYPDNVPWLEDRI